MEFTTEKKGTELKVSLAGELNALTAPELQSFLDKELPGMSSVILNFQECDYVSSAGLRVLLGTFKQMKAQSGSMILTNVGENFMEVLENTMLAPVFDIR
ncbi:MAG: STAS domain-containing protein [Clostridiales bacterium]|nr:STAS domain-containing protein [Clostridiales bacterium]